MIKELNHFLNSLKNKEVNTKPAQFLAENLAAFQQMESLGYGTYIYDYQNHAHHYISPNIFKLLEFTPAELKERNVEALFSKMPLEDSKRVIGILQRCISHVFSQDPKLSGKAVCRHFYRINNPNGPAKLILQTNKIFNLGKGFIDLGIVQLVGFGDALFPPYLHLQMGSIQKCFFPEGTYLGTVALTSREEEVMFWSLQGLPVAEIASKLNLSTEGVRFHRRRILKKYNARHFDAVLKNLSTIQ